MYYFRNKFCLILTISTTITILPASSLSLTKTNLPESLTQEFDSNCDCNDPTAYYHKTLRKISNEQGPEKMENFLKDINPKKVCGSDGVFYKIKCEFHCTKANNPEKANLEIAKPSTCRNKLKENILKTGALKHIKSHKKRAHSKICICSRHYAPVCASNGLTYGNKCAFECAKHYLDPDIVIVGTHKCNEDDQTALSQE